MSNQVECLWQVDALLGEGPVWVAEQNRLYFVDLKGHQLHAYDAAGGQHRSWNMPGYFCWLIARRDGDGFMAGLGDGVARVWLEPELRIEYLHRPFAVGSGLRMNDAKADLAGRIWAGTMHDTDCTQPVGQLFRLDPDLSLHTMARDYHICNGPAFGNDGVTMYHTDSLAGRVYSYPLAVDGGIGAPSVWRQFGEGEGSPDGMTVDSEGCVWIGHWGGARVCRYSPGGELLQTIPVPARNATSCAFGGADLKTLFITSASEGNTPEQLADYPQSGALFSVRVDVAGVPAARFG